MTDPLPRRLRAGLLVTAAAVVLSAAACAQTPAQTPAQEPAQTPAQTPAQEPGQAPAQAPASAPGPEEAPTRSALDAQLFYQLLLGEMQLRGGDAGGAYQAILAAARRTGDETLFRRAVEIALRARAGEDALVAVRAWRTALPDSIEALQNEVQLLVALNRPLQAVQPLRSLLAAAPAQERPGLIAGLPRLMQRAADDRQAATALEQALAPYAKAPDTRTAAHVALGRAWLAAGDVGRALSLAHAAQAEDPDAAGPALLALELMDKDPVNAEPLVLRYLARPAPQAAVRLAYVRQLTTSQRYVDAVAQLETLTSQEPQLAPPWLNLGALWLELREPEKAERALEHFVELARKSSPAGPDDPHEGTERALTQAWLMLAQAAEQRGDYAAAEARLARIEQPQRPLEVQARRAALLAHQNRVEEARELIRSTPEATPEDGRAKLLAEVQVLREVKRWREAHDLLVAANERFRDDADLLYEQAMMAEKLGRMEDMERLLRRVMELQPDHHHAYNALGYSLADRNLRLAEARELIGKALELAPNDPFITDSMGWVEYRLGNRQAALRLLRTAYGSRPDTEIAAHLGEVLWMEGEYDEARRILRAASSKDAGNEVLRETIARLKVDL